MTYIKFTVKGQHFLLHLYNLLMFFVPCMRPTPGEIHFRIISCKPSMANTTCYYDDQVKKICFSFLYPYQLWRVVTVNLLHVTWFHLLSDFSKQLFYGILLGRKYGSFRIVIVYWLSNTGSCLNFTLTTSGRCKSTSEKFLERSCLSFERCIRRGLLSC